MFRCLTGSLETLIDKYLDGKRYQVVDIYYSGVGILRELSPEEMEEAFQQRLAEQSQGKEIPA